MWGGGGGGGGKMNPNFKMYAIVVLGCFREIQAGMVN